jgi:NTP pyrophosphatase (non-canonical NTP hydrolase)
VRAFADSRDWQQFHIVRNLVLALVGETGELAAEFQWIGDDEVVNALQGPTKREAVSLELADVFIYLLRLADVTGIDLAEAVKATCDLPNGVRPTTPRGACGIAVKWRP